LAFFVESLTAAFEAGELAVLCRSHASRRGKDIVGS
jgi:hypothetical protein